MNKTLVVKYIKSLLVVILLSFIAFTVLITIYTPEAEKNVLKAIKDFSLPIFLSKRFFPLMAKPWLIFSFGFFARYCLNLPARFCVIFMAMPLLLLNMFGLSNLISSADVTGFGDLVSCIVVFIYGAMLILIKF